MESSPNEEFRQLTESPDRLLDFLSLLNKEYIEEGDFDELYIRCLKLICPELNRANLQWMEYYVESPIERYLVASLLCNFARQAPTSLIVTPNFLHGKDPIKVFEKVQKDVKSLLGNERFADRKDALKALELLDEEKAVSKEFYSYVKDHYLFYDFGWLDGALHLNLQPEFEDIYIESKKVRPDLMFWMPTNSDFRIVVECDGFKYHSDKKSFIYDRKRDRMFKVKGVDVWRFSGSEIFTTPGDVGFELFEMLGTFFLPNQSGDSIPRKAAPSSS